MLILSNVQKITQMESHLVSFDCVHLSQEQGRPHRPYNYKTRRWLPEPLNIPKSKETICRSESTLYCQHYHVLH